jgi:anti-sigma B factor antagonist
MKKGAQMTIKDSLVGDIVIIELVGKLMSGDEITLLHGKTHYYLNLSKKKFLFDLQRIEWSNSIGLGALIAVLSSVKKAEGKMVLANITNIESLLALTRLTTVFETYDTRAAAIAALS